MPGLHVVWHGGGAEENQRLATALDEQKSDPVVMPQILWQEADRAVAFSGHPAYPRRILRGSGVQICVEGAIYNRPAAEVDADLWKLAQQARDAEALAGHVRRFMESSDGEYLVLMDGGPEQGLILFNDPWGRLPVFYCHQPKLLAVSRSLRFLCHWLPEVRLEPLSIAEFLTLGHVLESRTLLAGVGEMPPGSLLRADREGGQIRMAITRLAAPVISEDHRVQRSEAVRRCVNLFLESVDRRLEWCRQAGWEITADISGGRDSRAIYAAMARLGGTATFYSDDLAGGDECRHLPELERLFGQSIRYLPQETPPVDFETMRHLTYVTDCRVNGWTTWFIEQKTLKRRQHIQSPAVRFMGLGAHVIKTLYRRPCLYRTMQSLARDEAFFFFFSDREINRLLKWPRGYFVRHVTKYFATYPEKELAHQLKRKYLEYEQKVVSAGEERQRRYFWTVAPFWSGGLYGYVLQSVPSALINRDFFDDFLATIDPRALQIPFHGRGRADRSWAKRCRYWLGIALERWGGGWPWLKFRRKYKSWICREFRPTPNLSPLDREILKTWATTPAAAAYFSETEVRRIASHRVLPEKKYQLLTVLHYLAELNRRFPVKSESVSETVSGSRGRGKESR